MILFLCTNANSHVVTWAHDREDAKRKALLWLGYDPELYVVMPLSRDGDRVHIAVTLNA